MEVTPDFPPEPEYGDDEQGGADSYWAEACGIDDKQDTGAGVTKVSLMVKTTSTKKLDNISIRYYYNGSEMSNPMGMQGSELYDQASVEAAPADGVISGPYKYDKLADTYYFEITFDGYNFANSAKKYQFTMGCYYGDMWTSTRSAGSNPDGYDLDRDGYTSDYVQTPEWADTGSYSWRVSSPSRVMVGVATTIAQRLILSVDYEAAFYSDMKLRRAPIKGLDYTATIDEMFRHANTIRIGAEFRALPCLDIRAGYIYSGDAIKSASLLYTHPLIKEQGYMTAGLGIRFNERTYLDLAYQYSNTKQTSYQTLFATGIDATGKDVKIESVPVTTELTKHIAVLTLGFRF
jgi:hypothetical protein